MFVLGPNQLQRFYQGGAEIAGFRGAGTAADGPEDWVASTTTAFGEEQAGLSRLPDGRLLADAVGQQPEWFLGPEHVAAYGADTGLLVKLLDAGQRLPVHCHPDRAYSRANLSCPHGKTEAWIVLRTGSADACVYLGFRDDIPASVRPPGSRVSPACSPNAVVVEATQSSGPSAAVPTPRNPAISAPPW